MQKIYLIGCGSKKLAGRHKAKDLYISSYFRKKLEYAQHKGGPYFILSAKCGLLDPEREVCSYNLSIKDLSADEKRTWAKNVEDKLVEQFPDSETVFVMLCGKDYWGPVAARIGEERCEFPLAHMGIGKQLRFLTEAMENG